MLIYENQKGQKNTFTFKKIPFIANIILRFIEITFILKLRDFVLSLHLQDDV